MTSSPCARRSGGRIYALGGNEKAARLSGVKTQWLSFYTFVNMGVARRGRGPGVRGPAQHREPKGRHRLRARRDRRLLHRRCVASGGVGKVLGAVIGALVMGVMNNGMSILASASTTNK